MTNSILTSVKKTLGLEENYTEFDLDIIMAINTAFNILTQIGAGPKDGFQIVDSSSSWEEFTKNDKRLNMVKTYVNAKVRLIFDPPQMTSITECLKEVCREMESRISYEVDPDDTFKDSGGDEDGWPNRICRADCMDR